PVFPLERLTRARVVDRRKQARERGIPRNDRGLVLPRLVVVPDADVDRQAIERERVLEETAPVLVVDDQVRLPRDDRARKSLIVLIHAVEQRAVSSARQSTVRTRNRIAGPDRMRPRSGREVSESGLQLVSEGSGVEEERDVPLHLALRARRRVDLIRVV